MESFLANATVILLHNFVAYWEEHYQELIDLALLEETYPGHQVLAPCLKMHMNRHDEQDNYRNHQKIAMFDVCENLRWGYHVYPGEGQHLCDLLVLQSHHVVATAPWEF